MSMNIRFKEIRKTLGLTQTNFGMPLGLKQSSVVSIEKGINSVTERTILFLCKTYNVNRDWFMTGDGDMFTSVPVTMIDEVAKEYGLDETSRSILSAYTLMCKEKRTTFNTLLKELLSDLTHEDEPKEEVPLAPLNPAIPEWDEFDVEEETERIRQELIEEKRAKAKSSASIERKQA